MDAKLFKDNRFWFASFLVAWAAALQKQDSFKAKFGDLDKKDNVE